MLRLSDYLDVAEARLLDLLVVVAVIAGCQGMGRCNTGEETSLDVLGGSASLPPSCEMRM